MSDTIKEIAKACQTLEGKDSSPTAVKLLRTLHFQMTKLYVLRLCSWMRATTKEISKDDTWVILSTLERNKSPYAISCMPLEFRDIIISAMDRIDTMILNLMSETAKSYDISQPLQEINESVRLAFLNSFLDFAGYLERFGGELTENRPNNENNYVQNGYINGTRETSANTDGDLHKKLLVVLSNIGYCKAELSEELYTTYRHIWSPVRNNDERSSDMRDLMTSFSALEEKVLDQYTFAKSNLIRSSAQSYLLDPGIYWGAAPMVKVCSINLKVKTQNSFMLWYCVFQKKGNNGRYDGSRFSVMRFSSNFVAFCYLLQEQLHPEYVVDYNCNWRLGTFMEMDWLLCVCCCTNASCCLVKLQSHQCYCFLLAEHSRCNS
ncbi:Exocyst complex component SEC5A [Zea mays]|nr:Exocyst complex component SEC5A [Zea mays]